MDKRYEAKPHIEPNGMLSYRVIDTKTGNPVHCYDCMLWAEKKAKEMNEKCCACSGGCTCGKHEGCR